MGKILIPYGRQSISEEDIEAVVSILRSDFLTQGPAVSTFERAVSEYCGAAHAVAVNSATSALHIACLALGVGPGDTVWTSPITFAASANCALYCGAKVDFVDIDAKTFNLNSDLLAVKLAYAEVAGCLPKAVIPVHMCGLPCDMAAIYALSQRYGFKIIEDASHAIGGEYKGGKIGNCQYSDITVFSFHPVKVITTGEGGMAVTNDLALAKIMQLYGSHGITRDPRYMDRPSDGEWYYQQIKLGFNYRITDLQAALGTSQMQRLDEFVEKRHNIADRYHNLLTSLPLTFQHTTSESYSGQHLFVVRLKLDAIKKTHYEVFTALRMAGIGVNLHYIPVYRHPYYEKLGFKAGYCPKAESYYSDAMSLPMYVSLTEEQQNYVVSSLSNAVG